MARAGSSSYEVSEPPEDRLGPFRLFELIANGGMSHVYLAKRDGATRFSVVKVLRRSAQESGSGLKRIRREAHVASFLNHPNVARVLGAGVDKGQFYVAYEFIPGQTVADLLHVCALQGRKIPISIAVTIGLRTLLGLSHAHELKDGDSKPLNVVHRDITPQNLMVSYSGEVKIIDFGVARARVDCHASNPGFLVGTPQYMSPEQVSGMEVDARTDVYSTASVIYEMLTLRTPVSEQNNFRLLFGAIILERPDPPSQHVSGLPPALDAVLLRALAKKANERHQTAREFREDLEAATRHVPRATATDLATFVSELLPMERRHLIALQAENNTHGAAKTVDEMADVYEASTEPGFGNR